MSDWNSAQYLKFESQRTRPSADLISRISDLEPKTVADLGCGPGNSTTLLAKSFKDARIIGLDSSDDMLAKAKSSYPELEFSNASCPTGSVNSNKALTLFFSNACIHWIKSKGLRSTRFMKSFRRAAFLPFSSPHLKRADFYRLLGSLTADGKWKKLSQVRNFHALSPRNITMSCRLVLRVSTFGKRYITTRWSRQPECSNGTRAAAFAPISTCFQKPSVKIFFATFCRSQMKISR